MDTYPVNLLLSKRKCLLVGGGKVASRKVQNLADSGAYITVIAKAIAPRIKELSEKYNIQLLEREFKESDLDGVFLIYLATTDRKLNYKISQLAEKRNILTCMVDANWRKGSFITPACVSSRDITVAVSSQGTDCIRARLIKNNFARHIDLVENINLMVIGSNHHLMPLSDLEKLQLGGGNKLESGKIIQNLWGIQEFFFLHTCNRIELIAVGTPSESLYKILKMILKLDTIQEDQYYIKSGYDAFEQICSTVAGISSQTPGENHITSQFKEACAFAIENGWADTILDSLRNSILHVSRQIRNECKLLFKNFEIEEMLVQILEEEGVDLLKKRVLVLGSGMLGSAVKDIFVSVGSKIDWLYFSNKPKDKDSTVSVDSLDTLLGKLKSADIVVCALACESPVITDDMSTAIKSGATLFDLGMPKNISSSLLQLREDIDLHTMEDLKYYYRKHHTTADSLKMLSERIINDHKDEYDKFSNKFISRG